MVNLSKLKPGVKIKLLDGTVTTVRGSYMSGTGLVLTAREGTGGIVDRNVPIEDVVEVVDALS